MLIKVTLLPGDGIGPEVVAQARLVLEATCEVFGHELNVREMKIGGAALLAVGEPLPAETVAVCLASGAVLLGAVGGPQFDRYPPAQRPESGLLRLRRELGVFANLRPALSLPSLEGLSPLRPEIVRHTDIMIVRELLGGLYFGERSTEGETGSRRARDTMAYSEPEIERIARVAFQLAGQRHKRVTSVDKANVLDCSRLWREVVTRVGEDFREVELSHMYVDSAAMALVARPSEFDVLLTENMFGDILSDQAGAVVGSLGLLPSASIGGKVGLYEPIHGSAPNIAGQNIANPLGAVLSTAMLLRHSFQLEREALAIESAARGVLGEGNRTRDLAPPGKAFIGTREMGELIGRHIRSTQPAAHTSRA
jgi:3-isopropylmalate dehydrogenase